MSIYLYMYMTSHYKLSNYYKVIYILKLIR